MKLVVKFGGTSLATVKDIKNVVKTVDKISKNNKTVVVCSAIDTVTDELIQISSLIGKGNKKEANRVLAKISQKHKQFATHLITNSKILKWDVGSAFYRGESPHSLSAPSPLATFPPATSSQISFEKS